jgi:transcriptional regulator GlxA family with amidase domain
LTGRPALSIGFVLTNNFTFTALSTFVDALRLSADEGDLSRPIRCHWAVMGPERRPIKASCGIEVIPPDPFRDPRHFDYVVVVGGLLHRGPQLDAESEAYVRKAADCGVPLVGVCTGSFVLVRAGLMKGRSTCVSWYHYHDFLKEFPTLEPVADQIFVDDGDRITCSGGTGVLDLAAYLIEKHCGKGSARKALHILQTDQPRPPTGPQPQPALTTNVASDKVRKAIIHMEQHISDPLSIEELSRRIGLSTRQFERLFRVATTISPTVFYRSLRLRYGLWRLTRTRRSITEIAQECGFADCAHFSRQFRALYKVPPSEIRRSSGTAVETPAFLAHVLADEGTGACRLLS